MTAADCAVPVSNISSCYFKDINITLNANQVACNGYNITTGHIRSKFSSLQKSEATIGPLCGLFDDTGDPDSSNTNAGRTLRQEWWCSANSTDKPKVKHTTALLDTCLKNQNFPLPPGVEVNIILTPNSMQHLIHCWDADEQKKKLNYRVRLLRLEIEFKRLEVSKEYHDAAYNAMKKLPVPRNHFSYLFMREEVRYGSPILGTRGAVLHYSAELVLSFRIHICAFPFSKENGPRVPSAILFLFACAPVLY